MRVALVSHLIEKSNVSVLKLCISFWEISCKDVTYAETISSDLVCVSRSDTLEGRSDLALSHSRFVGRIKKSVCRKDKVSLLSDYNALSHRNACFLRDILALALESDRVKDHAVSDDILRSLSEDS